MARHKMFVNVAKAQRELNFHPSPLEAALERAIHWYSENGYLKSPLRSSEPKISAA
jgi:nucleoside-diphosphate-sugar epimerase